MEYDCPKCDKNCQSGDGDTNFDGEAWTTVYYFCCDCGCEFHVTECIIKQVEID